MQTLYLSWADPEVAAEAVREELADPATLQVLVLLPTAGPAALGAAVSEVAEAAVRAAMSARP
jgi:hypothetical protein